MVWYWSENCQDGKMMGLDLLLDGKRIYHLEFRACLMKRNNADSPDQTRMRKFHLAGGHTFQGTYRTVSSDKIEGDIWQADADPDALSLGVSFMTKDQVLLNTIHTVKPGKVTRFNLDSGLISRSYPLTTASGPASP
jgi:hypothetical protein